MQVPFKNVFKLISLGILLMASIWMIDKWVLSVPANKILVVQTPSGEMHVYNKPGWQNQHFGSVIGDYPKFESVNFDIPEEEKDVLNYDSAWVDNRVGMYGIQVTFNDNGTAILFGTVPVEMPTDPQSILMIQEKHGGWASLQSQIIRKQLTSALSTQIGALMTSREANAEKRSDLVGYLEDMVRNGLYQTRVRVEKEVDPITKDTVVIKYAERIPDPNAPGGFKRQAPSEITKYNIRIGTPAINRIVFSNIVKKQLASQQEMTMAIATSKAEALVAQQNAKTSAAEAEARIAKVQADLNAKKEEAVIEAQKRMEVAALDMKAAESLKRKAILEGEGEAEKKRLLMSADGALNPKLEAFVEVQKAWADAWAKNGAAVVPTYISGAGGASPNGVQNLMDLKTIMDAKALGLDLSITGKK